MNAYAWGAALFVVVFLGLGVGLVFLVFQAGRGARTLDVEVGGVPVTVGG